MPSHTRSGRVYKYPIPFVFIHFSNYFPLLLPLFSPLSFRLNFPVRLLRFPDSGAVAAPPRRKPHVFPFSIILYRFFFSFHNLNLYKKKVYTLSTLTWFRSGSDFAFGLWISGLVLVVRFYSWIRWVCICDGSVFPALYLWWLSFDGFVLVVEADFGSALAIGFC